MLLPLDARFEYVVDRVPADVLDIPGVYSTKKGLHVPRNAEGVVVTQLAEAKIAPVRLPPTGRQEAPACSPELHAWVMPMLTSYQQEGTAFAIDLGGGHLWWAPGSGKSLGAIVWALSAGGPVLVVTRASVRGTWVREVKKYTTVEPYVLQGESTRRAGVPEPDEYLAACQEQGVRPFVIVSWEGTALFTSWLVDTLQPVSVVWDEAHKGKSPRRSKAVVGPDGRAVHHDLENLASSTAKIAFRTRRRLATTATPVKDRLRDLWAQLELVEPKAWGSYHAFIHRYCDARQGEFGIVAEGMSNIPELKARLAKVTHHVPYSVSHAQLPAKRRETVYLPLSEQDKPLAMKREIQAAAKTRGEEREKTLLEAKLAEAASRKRSYLREAVREAVDAGEKVLVFTTRRKVREALAETLQGVVERAQGGFWTCDGSTPTRERDAMREAYMSHPGPAVLVTTGDAMGEGVDLQDTDLFLIAMLPYTPGQLWQWENRVSRLGQKRPVLVRYIVAESTIDEHVADLLLGKLPAVDAVIADSGLDGVSDSLAGLDDPEGILDGLFSKLSEVKS